MKKLVLVLLSVCLLAAKDDVDAKKPKSRFPLGKETTFVTEPLDADGYIDYAAALNEHWRRGVTPENNANVLLWKALGPHPEGATMPDEFFKWLGIKPLAEKGDYFLPPSSYVKERLKAEQLEENHPIFEESQRCSQRPWTAKQCPNIAGWLNANEKPLALVVEATRRTQYYCPLVPKSKGKGSPGLITALVPSVQECRELANALTARAMLHLGEGRFNDAWQDLLACHRLSRLVGRGATFIELHVGIAIDAIAGKADSAFLEHAQLTSEQLNKCLLELRELPPMHLPADKLDLGERFMFLDAVVMLDRDGGQALEAAKVAEPFLSLFQRKVSYEQALRKGNRWYDRMAQAMRVQDRKTRGKELTRIDKETTEMVMKSVKSKPGMLELLFSKDSDKIVGEHIGNILIGLLIPAVGKVINASDRCEQLQSNLYVAFALAAYHRDHGRYPKELEALVPKYLDKIPHDLFSDKPLIYQLTEKGYLLYCVGVNAQDEHGQTYDDQPQGDDLSIRMPLPKLRQP